MNLFGKLGNAVDGVIGIVTAKTIKTAVKVYETKTPAISVETLVDAGATKVKIAASVVKKSISNGKARLKAMKDAKPKEKKEENQQNNEHISGPNGGPLRTITNEDTAENYGQ